MKIDYTVLEQMREIREICKEAHKIRLKNNIPLSQPLSSITINPKYYPNLFPVK